MYYDEWLVEPEPIECRQYTPTCHQYGVIDYIFEKYKQTYCSCIHITQKTFRPGDNVFDCIIDLNNNIYFTFTFQNFGRCIEIKLYEITDELTDFVNQWTNVHNSIGRNNIAGINRHLQFICNKFRTEIPDEAAKTIVFIGGIKNTTKLLKEQCMNRLYQHWLNETETYIEERLGYTFK